MEGGRKVFSPLPTPPEPYYGKQMWRTYEAGKMGKCKDLGTFDKGQIVMTRPLDQSFSKTAALVGCSRSAVLRLHF
ncbi:hypothetical protein QTP86_016419 [Hemibagrus guttatus]|nr:hypothetical protein QTP86_016419 [Hemibagrus guttatus]